MQIQKRDGRFENYDRNKIARAMQKALAEVGDPSGKDEAALEALLVHVEQAIEETGAAEVEKIQDLVERTLMESGHFDAAKAYILYRHKRSELRRTRQSIVTLALGSSADAQASARLDAVLTKISRENPLLHSVGFDAQAQQARSLYNEFLT